MIHYPFSPIVVITIIWLHFVSDFIFQSDWMAKGKSSSNSLLTLHVLCYSVLFLMFFGPEYALVNFALHWVTDWCTSRATKRLWAAGETHWFFAVIGLDQAIHMTCLIVTIPLIRTWIT